MLILAKEVDGEIQIKTVKEWFPNTMVSNGVTADQFPGMYPVSAREPHDPQKEYIVACKPYLKDGVVYTGRKKAIPRSEIVSDITKTLYEDFLDKKDFQLRLYDAGYTLTQDEVDSSEFLSDREKFEFKISTSVNLKSEIIDNIAKTLGMSKEDMRKIFILKKEE